MQVIERQNRREHGKVVGNGGDHRAKARRNEKKDRIKIEKNDA
jgi:hypothetical protein